MDFAQSLRRIGQQMKGWNESFSEQNSQAEIIKKLYAKNGLDLIMTCGACPEQYDVFKDGVQVGFLYLRHGEFYVEIPDCGGRRIFEAYPNGDGMFDADERLTYMSKAMRALIEHLN